MAVYSVESAGESRIVQVQVTKRFKVYDTVAIVLKDGTTKKGEIVYIEADKVHITGPYMPIEEVEMNKIADITCWTAPDNWR